MPPSPTIAGEGGFVLSYEKSAGDFMAPPSPFKPAPDWLGFWQDSKKNNPGMGLGLKRGGKRSDESAACKPGSRFNVLIIISKRKKSRLNPPPWSADESLPISSGQQQKRSAAGWGAKEDDFSPAPTFFVRKTKRGPAAGITPWQGQIRETKQTSVPGIAAFLHL